MGGSEVRIWEKDGSCQGSNQGGNKGSSIFALLARDISFRSHLRMRNAHLLFLFVLATVATTTGGHGHASAHCWQASDVCRQAVS